MVVVVDRRRGCPVDAFPFPTSGHLPDRQPQYLGRHFLGFSRLTQARHRLGSRILSVTLVLVKTCLYFSSRV